MQEGVKWDYFKKFTKINDKYLPDVGEGDTQATQIVLLFVRSKAFAFSVRQESPLRLRSPEQTLTF